MRPLVSCSLWSRLSDGDHAAFCGFDPYPCALYRTCGDGDFFWYHACFQGQAPLLLALSLPWLVPPRLRNLKLHRQAEVRSWQPHGHLQRQSEEKRKRNDEAILCGMAHRSTEIA